MVHKQTKRCSNVKVDEELRVARGDFKHHRKKSCRYAEGYQQATEGRTVKDILFLLIKDMEVVFVLDNAPRYRALTTNSLRHNIQFLRC